MVSIQRRMHQRHRPHVLFLEHSDGMSSGLRRYKQAQRHQTKSPIESTTLHYLQRESIPICIESSTTDLNQHHASLLIADWLKQRFLLQQFNYCLSEESATQTGPRIYRNLALQKLSHQTSGPEKNNLTGKST